MIFLNFKKFRGRNKEIRAEEFISDRAAYGEVWEIVENHGQYTLVKRRKHLED